MVHPLACNDTTLFPGQPFASMLAIKLNHNKFGFCSGGYQPDKKCKFIFPDIKGVKNFKENCQILAKKGGCCDLISNSNTNG